MRALLWFLSLALAGGISWRAEMLADDAAGWEELRAGWGFDEVAWDVPGHGEDRVPACW